MMIALRDGLLVLMLVPMLSQGGGAQAQPPDSFFSGRPAFSRPEQGGSLPATCDTIAAQLPDDVPGAGRVDLAITGPVTLVRSDGALWYVAVCTDPGVRVLCVTYEGNGLRPGDIAILRGGYSRQDSRHVLLDPCLASAGRGED
jgi:hypothetical protein